MTTLNVGNLPFSATASGVRGLFEQHGAVPTVKVIDDRGPRAPHGVRPEGGSGW